MSNKRFKIVVKPVEKQKYNNDVFIFNLPFIDSTLLDNRMTSLVEHNEAKLTEWRICQKDGLTQKSYVPWLMPEQKNLRQKWTWLTLKSIFIWETLYVYK